MSSVAACTGQGGAAFSCFRSVCEENLDESFERLVVLYGKQLDYSLSISIAGYEPSQLTR